MAWLLTKYLLTAGIVVLVSELARRSDRLGAFVAALPTVTLLVLIWLYVEKQSSEKIAAHAWYTFWYVIPTLPMFLVFPWIYPKIGFWPALLVSVLVTLLSFGLFGLLLRRFGVVLF